MAKLLEVEGLTKSFFGVTVLHEVGFSVAAGEALGLVGENGSGKSTSMNILGGVHQPNAGAMRLEADLAECKLQHGRLAGAREAEQAKYLLLLGAVLEP